MTPFPAQIAMAEYCAPRRRAFVFSQARCGKTGALIMAADYILAMKILVVTTASGRGVWRKAFPAWSKIPRRVRVLGVDDLDEETDVGIVSWGSLNCIPRAIRRRPDLIILDEDQRAVTPDAQRTQNVYGRVFDDGERLMETGVVRAQDRVWHATGNPMPHDLGDMWMRVRASFPQALLANPARGWPDVTRCGDFEKRYCIIATRKLPDGRRIPIERHGRRIIVGGQNGAELENRLEFIRFTQEDVGIQPPRYEMLPLIVSAAQRAEINQIADQSRVLRAIDAGKTREIEMDLGVLRRLTGSIKAPIVVKAVKDEFYSGLDKIVLAYWHRDTGDILAEGLRKYGVIRLDGATPPKLREKCESDFRSPKYRVFLAQIASAGEAIDLSPACELWFVEQTFSPKDMEQMAKRITNITQKRTCYVKVCTIEGSIDEPIQQRLTQLWAPINEVLQQRKIQ